MEGADSVYAVPDSSGAGSAETLSSMAEQFQ